jgi:hypothetical protein
LAWECPRTQKAQTKASALLPVYYDFIAEQAQKKNEAFMGKLK